MVSETKRGDPSVRGLSYTPHLKWSTPPCSPIGTPQLAGPGVVVWVHSIITSSMNSGVPLNGFVGRRCMMDQAAPILLYVWWPLVEYLYGC